MAPALCAILLITFAASGASAQYGFTKMPTPSILLAERAEYLESGDVVGVLGDSRDLVWWDPTDSRLKSADYLVSTWDAPVSGTMFPELRCLSVAQANLAGPDDVLVMNAPDAADANVSMFTSGDLLTSQDFKTITNATSGFNADCSFVPHISGGNYDVAILHSGGIPQGLGVYGFTGSAPPWSGTLTQISAGPTAAAATIVRGVHLASSRYIVTGFSTATQAQFYQFSGGALNGAFVSGFSTPVSDIAGDQFDFDSNGLFDALFGTEGDGTLAMFDDGNEMQVTVPSTDRVQKVFWVDLDGDGDFENVSLRNTGGPGPGPIQVNEFVAGSWATSYTSTETEEWLDAVIVDVNGDGYPDVLAVNALNEFVYYQNDGGLTCDVDANCGIEDFCKSGACTPRHGLEETLAGSITLSRDVNEVWTADMNSDGNMDIVVASPVAPHIEWFAGDGAGNYPNSSGQYTHSDPVDTFVLGDVDNDGDDDIIFGSSDTGVPTFYVLENSGGSLSPRQFVTTLDATGPVSDLELADIDQDGDLDLFVAQDDGGFSIYQNLGIPLVEGTFTETSRFTTEVLAFPLAQIAVGNVDGDPNGVLDVVLASGDSQVTRLFRGFDRSRWSFDSVLTVSAGTQVTDIALGNRNAGATRLDAVVSSGLQNGTLGYSFGVFQWAGGGLSNAAEQVELGDVSGNGSLEAIIYEAGPPQTIKVYESIVAPLQFQSIVPPKPLRDMVWADASGDGMPDLVVALSDGAFSTIGYYESRNPGFHGTGESFAPNAKGYTSLSIGDINNNGTRDLVVSGPDPSPGAFQNTYYENSITSIGYAANSSLGNRSISAVADLDSDNDLDLIFFGKAGETHAALENQGGTFNPITTLSFQNANNINAVGFLDDDADGDLDVFLVEGATLNRYQNDGGWSFGLPTTISSGIGDTLKFADLNGDGIMDMLASSNSGEVITSLGTGSGFAPGVFNTLEGLFIYVDTFEVADFNGDGIPDVAAGDKGGGACVFPGDGTGNFPTSSWCNDGTVHETLESVEGIAVGDVNVDGFVDLVITSADSEFNGSGTDDSPIRLYLGDGNGSFELAWTINQPEQAEAVALVDLDRDSDLDLVVTSRSTAEGNAIYRNQRLSNELYTSIDRDTRPNNPSSIEVVRPLVPFGLDASTAQRVPTGVIDIPVIVRDFESDPVRIELEYSLGGGPWNLATVDNAVEKQFMASSRTGEMTVLKWDAQADGVTEGIVRMRAKIIGEHRWSVAAPLRYLNTSSVSASFTIGSACDGVSCGGDVCVEGNCYQSCTTTAGCGGTNCYLPTGRCASTACDGITCPTGQSCHGGTCYPSCVDDGDCAPPNLCFDNRCAASACDGVNCAEGEFCVGGSCRISCMNDGDCGGNPCVNDGSGVGNFCQNDPDPCVGVDCPGSETCIEGACFSQCLTNADCAPPFGDACYPLPVDGTKSGCSTLSDPCKDIVCPAGETCVEGACFQACSVSGDCTVDPSHVCYDATYCNDPDDSCSNISCPGGYACYQGACYPGCVDTGDCSPPLVCHQSACVSGSDPCQYVNCAEGEACYQGSCYPECATNGDCDPPFSVCFDSTVCQDTFDPCAGVVCPAGEACHEGTCFQSCSDSDPCSAPQVCYQDFCNTAGDPCDGVTCPSGETCWEGGCFETCSVMSDCTSPTQCFEDPVASSTTERCVYDACDGIACPLGEVCYQGGCFEDCSGALTCTDPFDTCYDSMRCATSACEDVECPVGQVCYQGSCVVECTANAECPGYIGGVGFIDESSSTNLALSTDKAAGATMGDIDLDGDVDGVANTTSSGTRLLLHDGNYPDPLYSENTPTTAPSLFSPSRERSVVLGDYTGDGYLDVARNTVGVITVSENAGSSPWYPDSLRTHFTSSSPSSTYSYNTEGLGWIDYDGDGDLDLIAQNQNETAVVLENAPEGTLNQLDQAAVNAIGFTDDANGDFLAMGDLEPDGDVDILFRMPGTSPADLYINNGDGTFTASSAFNQNASGGKGGSEFCDLDNDGDLDIVWSRDPLNIWENDGAGGWIDTGEPLTSAGLANPSGVQGVGCGDFDNDGDLDIYVSINGADILFENRTAGGTWNFVQNQFGVVGPGDSEAIHMVDYDRSGSLDIWVNRDGSDGSNLLWRNTREDDHYLAITPLVETGSGNFRHAIGATVVIRDPDGNILGTRTAGNAKGQGGQQAMTIHYGLPYGPNVPYDLEVIYPGNVRTRVCVVPTLTGTYQEVTIADTDTDDVAACTYASGWSALIEPPSDGDFCFDGRCAGESCEGIDCPEGETCYGGNCKVDCSGGASCPVGESCVSGTCVDSGDPACDADTFVCQLGHSCVNGDCLPLCSADADCAAGQYCYQGVCTPDSCASVTCPSGDVCYRGLCFEDCSSTGTCSTSGDSCFEGRCATDGCAALTDAYDSGFIYRDTGRRLYGNQVSQPFFWPRPVEGAAAVSASAWLGFSGGSVSGDAAPPARTARVYMYLDDTASDGDNGLGRYALWLATGPDGPACSTLATPLSCNPDSRCVWNTGTLTCERAEAGPSSTYRIRIKDPGDTPQILLNDDNEGVRIIKPYSSPDEWVITTQVTNASDTGGMLIGYLDASEARDWIVQIDASFSGGIDAWEFYSPDGFHVPLDPGQVLTLKSLPNPGAYRYTPDAGTPCTSDPIDPTPDGICGKGTSWCEYGTMRCQFTVQPWQFEVCDGIDNDCNGFVDDDVHVPEVEWRQGSGSSWVKWITYDTSSTAASILNFTPRAGDDRVGTVDILDVDGNPLQAVERQVLAMHRNLRTGELNMAIAGGRLTTGGSVNSFSDEPMDMRMKFPGSDNTVDEMFVSWWDDRHTEAGATAPTAFDGGAVQDEVIEWEERSRFDLEWEIEHDDSGTAALREADAALLKAMWGGHSNDFKTHVSRLEWQDADDEDDLGDEILDWKLYSPRQSINDIKQWQDLRTRITAVPLADSTCDAYDTTSVPACNYGRYECNAGRLGCSPPSLAVCNDCEDLDGDGFFAYDPATCISGRDCDDANADINPGEHEYCNGYDDDCDGLVDIKDDNAYMALWGEARPTGAETCDSGAECGPAECAFRLACVCPDGPEDPLNPPPADGGTGPACQCSEGLAPPAPNMSMAPEDGNVPEERPFEDPDAACSAAGGANLPGLLVLFGWIVGLRLRQRKR